LQSAEVLRPNVIKSFIKGTLAILVLSFFLNINSSTFVNYLIFLGIAYTLIVGYMLFKWSNVYTIGEESIEAKRRFRSSVSVPYTNIGGLGYAQGMLAKRFKCGTVYLELKQGKGSHRSLGGVGVFPLRDVRNPVELMKDISDRLGPMGV
jgi:Bacterial PH domain